jgi:hypothetical protein
MKQKVFGFVKYLVVLTAAIGSIQWLIVNFLMINQEYYYNTLEIYGFLFLITLLLYIGVAYINSVFSQYTGYAFMASSFLKMILSVIFLLPIILKDDRSYTADVLLFFMPYFLYLLFETVFVVQLLKDKAERNV